LNAIYRNRVTARNRDRQPRPKPRLWAPVEN
jgi:hypothetical protein